LNKAVKRVLARAQDKQVVIFPEKQDKFYMAFDRYQAQPPEEAAAGPLLRMLKAMELALNTLIDSGGKDTQITDMARDPLPEEGGARTPAASSVRPSQAAATAKKDLVHRHPFEISFVTAESKFRKFVDDLISSKQQFFIPKAIKIENEKVKAPSKLAEGAGAAAPPPPAPGPDAPPLAAPALAAPEAKIIKIIVGEEKLQIAMRIEVADFEELAAPAPKK
jgi:hypothetical protein